MRDIDWQRLQELFHQAQNIPNDELDEFLDQACGDDKALKAEVLKLLESSHSDGADLTEQLSQTSQQLLAHLKQGTRIGPYQIIKELGQGGMGTVYLAERVDDQFEQQVAIKLIGRAHKTAAIAQRFYDERQILARLKHPNIALLLDGGTTESGEPYFAMEYLPGKDIISYCDDKCLNLTQRIKLFMEVCRAVSYAHGQLVLHRDIKPSNILILDSGQPKLLDFGIAKIIKADDQNPNITAQDQMIMTPEYASPEQILGENMGVASDIYQLGLVLYQLLTGQQAQQIAQASVAEVKSKVLDQQPLSPSQQVSGTHSQDPQSSQDIANNRNTQPEKLLKKLKGDLDTVVLKCLHKEPEQRYHTVNELADDLHAYLVLKPIKARGLSTTYRIKRFIRRHWLVVSTSSVAVVALVAGFTYSLINLEKAQQAELQATNEAITAEQISEFLVDMISNADPGQTDGETVTVLQVLQNSAAKIDRLDTQPEIQIKLLNVIGKAYMGLDVYDKAQDILQQSVDLAETLAPEDETLLIEPMYLLSIALASRSENKDSFELAQKALNIARKYNAVQAHLLIQYGSVLSNLNKFEEQLNILHEALKLVENNNDNDLFEEKVQVLRNLGKYHVQHGDFDSAEKYLLKGLELLNNNKESLKSQKLSLTNMLGQLYKINLRLEAGETLFRQALTLSQDIFGETHSETFLAYLALGSIQVRMQKLDEAQKNLDKALMLGEKTVGKTDSNYAAALRDYSDLKRFQGDYIGALRMTQESTLINSNNMGENNAQTLASQSFQLGPLLFLGRYTEALNLSNYLIDKFSEILPKDHPFMYFLYESQAKAYYGLGNFNVAAEGAKQLEKAVELKFNVSRLHTLFDVFLIQGDFNAAQEQLQQMTQLLTNEQSDDAMLKSRQLFLSAQMQSANGQFNDSIETMQNALNELLTVRTADHPLVQKYQMFQAQNLSQTNHHEKAVQSAKLSFDSWLKRIDETENNSAILALSLAEIFLQADQTSAASEIINQHSKTLQLAWGDKHPEFLKAQCLKGKIQVQQGNTQQGQQLQQTALAALTQELGENSPLVKKCQ